MVDFHSSVYLSPASDIAHLLLTSVDPEYLEDNLWSLVEEYYNTFNDTVAEFGLILKHIGTSFNHFKREVNKCLLPFETPRWKEQFYQAGQMEA